MACDILKFGGGDDDDNDIYHDIDAAPAADETLLLMLECG